MKNNKDQFLKTKKEIIDWLEYYNIKNYTLIPDEKYGFVVDINGDVNLENKYLLSVLVKFNIVNGSFSCLLNNLKSLEFCPHTVGKNFNCSNNNLTSLENAPINIGNNFSCSNNELTSLKGCPKIIYGNFYCSNNKLISLEHSAETVIGDFYCSNNKLTSLKGCPNKIFGAFWVTENQIKNYIFLPEKIGNIYLNQNEKYTFEEIYKIHLKDKAEYEKQLLNECIKTNNVELSKKLNIKI